MNLIISRRRRDLDNRFFYKLKINNVKTLIYKCNYYYRRCYLYFIFIFIIILIIASLFSFIYKYKKLF